MCLAGAVIAPWSLMQEVTGSVNFTVMTNIFVTESVKTFKENSAVSHDLSPLKLCGNVATTFRRHVKRSQHIIVVLL